ncbi:MAG: ABC transporter ATP-binding protein, partial [Phycisphaeraceae bacterium]
MPGTFRVLWRVMSGQRLRYGAAIAAIALATMCMYGVPLVGKATIDDAVARYAGEVVRSDSPPSRGEVRGGSVEQPVDASAQSTSSASADATVPQPLPGREGSSSNPQSAIRNPQSSPSSVIATLGGPDYLANNLWLAALAMAVLTAFAGLFTYMKGRLAARACEGIARNLRDQLYDHLNKLPCSYLDKADTGDLVQRCTSDVETTRLFLSVQVVDIGSALILLVTVLPIMLWLDVRMTIVSLVLVPVIIMFALIFFFKVKFRFKAVEEAESKMTTVVQENLTGIRVVRAFARQAFERDKFAAINGEYRDRSFKLVTLMAWYWTLSDILVLSQMCLSLAFGAYWIAAGEMSVGTVYAFLAYLQMMLWPVRQMGRILTDLGKAVVALGRIREILNEEEEGEGQGPGAKGQGIKGVEQPAAVSPLSPWERGPEQSTIRDPHFAIPLAPGP